MTTKGILKEDLTEAEMAAELGIEVATLRNRISAGKDHPPYFGKGQTRRFPIDAYQKWKKDRLKYEVAS